MRTAALACVIFLLALRSPDATVGGNPETPEAATDSKEYAPGVRIDWTNRRIEVAARVVLRKGPLELLACSPQTREHESIFVSQARPLHVYQAMGLIGLDPGHPVRYDEKTERWLPPIGTPLRLDVLCGDGEPIPASRMLKATGEQTVPDPMPWVFAGSTTDAQNRFAADRDGTLICVVDFESALITVGALHTSDNAQLWLEANTESIPPMGTECTLLIAAREQQAGSVEIRIESNDRVFLEGRPMAADELLARLKDLVERPDKRTVKLIAGPDADAKRVDRIAKLLQDAGIGFETVREQPKE